MTSRGRALSCLLSLALLAGVGCGSGAEDGKPAPIEPISTTVGAVTFSSNPYAYSLPALKGQS